MAASAFFISVSALSIPGIEGDADTAADVDFSLVNLQLGTDQVEQSAHNSGYMADALRRIEQDDIFIAGDSGHGVDVTDRGGDPLAEGLDDLVPGAMAQGVVDLLEIVQIKEQEGQKEYCRVAPG
jgi:hypothetical protein